MAGSDALLASGTLYLNRVVDGVAQGRVKMPGVAEFAITGGADIKQQISKDRENFGQVTAVVAIPTPAELKVTIRNFGRKAMAMGLMGNDVDLSEGSGTVTAEAIVAKLGVFVDLSQGNIGAASVVVTNDGATVTYVENTDYTINYTVGMLQAVSGGAIGADEALKVDFAHNAIDGFQVNGATVPQVEGNWMLDGKNLANGKNITIEIDSALLVSEAPVDFMSDDFNELSLKGNMATLDGKSQPYTVKSF